MASCEGGASQPSAPLFKRFGRTEAPQRECGFSLIEVLLAGSLLLGVLVPSAALLGTSDNVLSLNRAKVVAANLAAGQLEADRAAADNATWTSNAPQLPTPSSTSVPSGGELYSVAQGAGWCAESSNGSGDWTNYSSRTTADPPAYLVNVTVSWLDGRQSVSASETLTTPLSVTPPSTGSCPA